MVGFNMKYNQAKWFDYTCQWCVKVWGNHLFMLFFFAGRKRPSQSKC